MILLTIAGFIALRRSRAGKAWIDSFILKLPILGDLVQDSDHRAGLPDPLLHAPAGVALPDAMRVTAESANNAVYRTGLTTSARR